MLTLLKKTSIIIKMVNKNRIALLKETLKQKNINYFLLPNCDEFFSEYLPDNEKRIEYLTGFTGSNATIIFGADKSYFFTDGRYILQSQDEIDLDEFEVINIADIDVVSWILQNVKGEKISLNSKLTSLNFVKRCKQKNISLNLIDEDLVALDKTQDSAEIFAIGDKISGKSSWDKRAEIAKDANWDYLLVSDPQSLCWLLNIRSHDVKYTPLLLAYGILFKDGSFDLFVDASRLKNDVMLEKVNIINHESLAQRINELNAQNKVAQLDANSTNYWLYNLIARNVQKTDPCLLNKACKNEVEIFGAIKSHEIDGLAVTKFLAWLENNPQTDELEAEEKLLEYRKDSADFVYPSFRSISGFGSNGAIIHYHSEEQTNKKFVDGSLYLIDSGGQYLGKDFAGTTDITRTIAIGTPSDEMIEDYTRVLKGHIALARIKFPKGTSGANIDVLARSHLWNAGKNFDHGTGHGVGSFLSVHEGPYGISKRSQQELLPGMILSNEPGFYKAGEYGIRIENLMLVENSEHDGFLQFKTLTLAPLDARLIDFKMLTYPEKKWLREYHEKIVETFHEDMSEEEIKRLEVFKN